MNGPRAASSRTHCLGFALIFVAVWTALPERDAAASALTPTPEELAAREELGNRMPGGRLLWANGNTVYYSSIKNWNPQRAVNSGKTERNPRWSPDGKKILWLQVEGGQGSVWVMNSDFSGKTEVLSGVVDGTGGSAPGTISWVREGGAICAVSADRWKVLKHDLGTGQTTTVYDARNHNNYRIYQGGELRIGGGYLVIFRVDPEHVTEIFDLQGSKYIANSQMLRGDCSPGWAPDGSFIVNTARASSRPILKAPFNASAGTVSSSVHLVGMDTSYQYYTHGARVANDMNWVVGGVIWKAGPLNGNREIYCWRIGEPDSNAVRLTFDTNQDWAPSLYVGSGTVTAPSAPSGLSATAVSESRIDLSWTDTSGDEDGFKIERKTGAGSFGQIKTVGVGVTSCSDTGLAASTAYTYRVRAYNAGGDSAYSNEASATTAEPPAVPTTVITSPASGGRDFVEGSTVEVAGGGVNLTWYYDVYGDGKARIQFGTGSTATLTVTAGVPPENEFTLILEGDGGTDQQTHTIVSASGGPVAHWKLDETSGTTAADSSGNGHTGQLVNMTGDEWTAEGRIDGALRFIGADDYVLVDPPIDLGAEWTFAAWVWAPLVEGASWTSLTRAATDDHQILISFPSWELGTYENNGSGFNGCGFMMNALSAGWHHLAAVASGTQTVFYIDGAEVGTAGYKSDTDIGSIGNRPGDDTHRFSDKLDDVRLYERALSATEIEDLAEMGGGPVAEKSITVIAPNGGEILVPGQVYHIRWDVQGVQDVTILYSTAPGGNYEPIAFSVKTGDAGWLDYPWTVPDTPSATCRVLIEEYGGSGPSDESDAVFEIGVDVDADGLPDSWEVRYFGDIADCAPGDDSDGDGASNLEEHRGGTDPTDPASTPEDPQSGATGFGCVPEEARATALVLVVALVTSACLRRKSQGIDARRERRGLQ